MAVRRQMRYSDGGSSCFLRAGVPASAGGDGGGKGLRWRSARIGAMRTSSPGPHGTPIGNMAAVFGERPAPCVRASPRRGAGWGILPVCPLRPAPRCPSVLVHSCPAPRFAPRGSSPSSRSPTPRHWTGDSCGTTSRSCASPCCMRGRAWSTSGSRRDASSARAITGPSSTRPSGSSTSSGASTPSATGR